MTNLRVSGRVKKWLHVCPRLIQPRHLWRTRRTLYVTFPKLIPPRTRERNLGEEEGKEVTAKERQHSDAEWFLSCILVVTPSLKSCISLQARDQISLKALAILSPYLRSQHKYNTVWVHVIPASLEASVLISHVRLFFLFRNIRKLRILLIFRGEYWQPSMLQEKHRLVFDCCPGARWSRGKLSVLQTCSHLHILTIQCAGRVVSIQIAEEANNTQTKHSIGGNKLLPPPERSYFRFGLFVCQQDYGKNYTGPIFKKRFKKLEAWARAKEEPIQCWSRSKWLNTRYCKIWEKQYNCNIEGRISTLPCQSLALHQQHIKTRVMKYVRTLGHAYRAGDGMVCYAAVDMVEQVCRIL